MAAMDLPPGIAGYWGAVESAASLRLGIGGAFGAVNEARAADGLSPLSGVDAISMGRIYSLAVQQRNAGEAMQGLINNLQTAPPMQAGLIANMGIDAAMITQTISSGPLAVQATMPSWKIQFRVTTQGPEGPITEFRWINMGNDIPQTVGQLWDLVQTANDQMSYNYGQQSTPDGFIQVFAT